MKRILERNPKLFWISETSRHHRIAPLITYSLILTCTKAAVWLDMACTAATNPDPSQFPLTHPTSSLSPPASLHPSLSPPPCPHTAQSSPYLSWHSFLLALALRGQGRPSHQRPSFLCFPNVLYSMLATEHPSAVVSALAQGEYRIGPLEC